MTMLGIKESCARACINTAKNEFGQYSHKEISIDLTDGWKYSPRIMEAEIVKLQKLIELIEDYRPDDK